MDKIIMWIMACGALLGGIDRILGNRFGLGKKFEEGFYLLGPTALSMAGILCLVPLLARMLSGPAAALCEPLGIDPAMLGGILAVDMGGYQLAHELAIDPKVANFAGITVAAILGCTITFTIPIGMGMLNNDERTDFAQGILFGLIGIPAALISGGLLCGMGILYTLRQSLPVLILSALVLLGIWKNTRLMIRAFSVVARGISILTTLGLMLGAFEYMTGTAIIPGLAPVEDAMTVVGSIGVVMLGSLPVTELLKRALQRPLSWFGSKTGMNNTSAAGLLIGMVSVLPAIAMIKDMDKRGRIVNAAFVVCAASALAAQLGFVAGVNADLLPVLLASKFSGGICGALIALVATRKMPVTQNP